MKLLASTTLALFIPVVAWTSPSQMEVRVRLQRQLKNVEISGHAIRIAQLSNVISLGATRERGFSSATIRMPQPGQWSIDWANGNSMKVEGDSLRVNGQFLRLGVEPVPYNLEVIANPKSGFDVIARLDMETYLAGVLPAEMPVLWPLEALKAQAVASRSFVIRMARERRSRHFDVESTIIDQVYKFLHEVKTNPEWNTKLRRALEETRNEVLVDSNGRVLKAFFSADCGCQSEDPQFVWGKLEHHQSVKDASCYDRPIQKWNLTLDRQEVRGKLIAALDLPRDANLKTLQVGKRTPSGRVAEVVALIGVEGETKQFKLNSQEFRRIFGFKQVRSTDFSVTWLGTAVEIKGKGLGHGVGLCQEGAKTLAEQGMSYREILKKYYPQAHLRSPKST